MRYILTDYVTSKKWLCTSVAAISQQIGMSIPYVKKLINERENQRYHITLIPNKREDD